MGWRQGVTGLVFRGGVIVDTDSLARSTAATWIPTIALSSVSRELLGMDRETIPLTFVLRRRHTSQAAGIRAGPLIAVAEEVRELRCCGSSIELFLDLSTEPRPFGTIRNMIAEHY